MLFGVYYGNDEDLVYCTVAGIGAVMQGGGDGYVLGSVAVIGMVKHATI